MDPTKAPDGSYLPAGSNQVSALDLDLPADQSLDDLRVHILLANEESNEPDAAHMDHPHEGIDNNQSFTTTSNEYQLSQGQESNQASEQGQFMLGGCGGSLINAYNTACSPGSSLFDGNVRTIAQSTQWTRPPPPINPVITNPYGAPQNASQYRQMQSGIAMLTVPYQPQTKEYYEGSPVDQRGLVRPHQTLQPGHLQALPVAPQVEQVSHGPSTTTTGMIPHPAKKARDKRKRSNADEGTGPVAEEKAGCKKGQPRLSKNLELLRNAYATPYRPELLDVKGKLMSETELVKKYKELGKKEHKAISGAIYDSIWKAYKHKVPNFPVIKDKKQSCFHYEVLEQLKRSDRFTADWPTAHAVWRDMNNKGTKQYLVKLSKWVSSPFFTHWTQVVECRTLEERKLPFDMFSEEFRWKLFAIRILINRGSPDIDIENDLTRLIKEAHIGFLLSPDPKPQTDAFWHGYKEAWTHDNYSMVEQMSDPGYLKSVISTQDAQIQALRSENGRLRQQIKDSRLQDEELDADVGTNS